MIVLDDWQEEILHYKGNILLASGRQVGKSQVFSIKAVYEMLEAPTRIIVTSLTEDQAKLIIIMVQDYIQKMGQSHQLCKGDKKPTQNKVELKNGSWIIARPVGNTGDALRGFTADVLFLDEVGRYSELIITAARPTLATTGGRIWMASTFNAKQGFFWEMFSKNPNGRFKIWHKSTEQVYNDRPIAGEWTEKRKKDALEYLEGEKATMSKALYGQEYLGIPLDDMKRFFEEAWISKVCIAKRPERPNPQGRHFMGNDIARMGGDQFTAEIFEKKEKVIQVESYGRRFLDTVDNENEILKFDRIWNNEQIGLDAGSGTLGVSVLDHLRRVDGMRHKLVAMNNRDVPLDKDGKKKQRLNVEDYYDNLKSMGEKGELELLDDPDVKESLRSIQLDIVEDKDKPGRITNIHIWGADSHHAEGITRGVKLAQEAKGINFNISYL